MRRILVAGLFADRNRTFFQALCRRFEVLASEETGFTPDADGPFEPVERPPLGGGRTDDADFAWEFSDMARFTERTLSSMLSRPVRLDPDERALLFEQATEQVTPLQRYRAVLDRTSVDMVVTSSDYSAHSRPVVIEARRRSIPSLCIEHGYGWTFLPTRDLFEDNRGLLLEYVSDCVNLDNRLEVLTVQRNLEALPPAHRPELVALGTPLDDGSIDGRDGATARAALGLDDSRRVVLVSGTWLECRSPTSAFGGQLELAEFYGRLFETYARWNRRDDVRILIKLHPALTRPNVVEDVEAFIRRTATEGGVEPPVILRDRLPEALAVADFVVCAGFTSLFRDAFTHGKPAILQPSPSYLDTLRRPEDLRHASVMLEAGCIRVAYTGDEVWSIVGELLDPPELRKFHDAVDAVRTEYDLQEITAAEKSQRICDWIEERLGRPS